MHMPLHLHMPLSIWGGCRSRKEGKRAERRRESCFLIQPQGGLLSLTVYRKEREEGERKKQGGGGETYSNRQTEREGGTWKKRNLLLSASANVEPYCSQLPHSFRHSIGQSVRQSPACQSNTQAAGESEVLRGFWFIPVSWRLVQFHNQDWKAGSWQVMGFWMRKQKNRKMYQMWVTKAQIAEQWDYTEYTDKDSDRCTEKRETERDRIWALWFSMIL